MKKGLLLINLGTPAKPTIKAVRAYLKSFLIDKRVIDLPAPWRYLLLYGFILPFRPRQSAKAYQAIWTSNGSPLLHYSSSCRVQLQQQLGEEYQVALGMRYGEPSISSALKQLKTCETLTILPLFPQYSSAATGSSLEETMRLLSQQRIIPHIKVIRDFHTHPGFIDSQAALIKPYMATHDHLLFSYHGLPERQLLKDDCKEYCPSGCQTIARMNSSCYRAQCLRTSAALIRALNLNASNVSSAFQSRLGRTPWIKPYTDELLMTLAAKGVKRLAVACPSFVADCLETLEEIGLRAKTQWLNLGGEQLTLIPALNDHPSWIETLTRMVRTSSSL